MLSYDELSIILEYMDEDDIIILYYGRIPILYR